MLPSPTLPDTEIDDAVMTSTFDPSSPTDADDGDLLLSLRLLLIPLALAVLLLFALHGEDDARTPIGSLPAAAGDAAAQPLH